MPESFIFGSTNLNDFLHASWRKSEAKGQHWPVTQNSPEDSDLA